MLLQPGMFPASSKEKQYICRECKSKYDRTYRQKNKEIIKEKRAEYYLKKRDYFLLKENPSLARLIKDSFRETDIEFLAKTMATRPNSTQRKSGKK